MLDDELAAVAGYEHFNGESIELSLATADQRWKLTPFLQAIFEYPFTQLGVERITAHIDVDNVPCWKRAEKLGFVREGELRRARKGKNTYVYGLLREDYGLTFQQAKGTESA